MTSGSKEIPQVTSNRSVGPASDSAIPGLTGKQFELLSQQAKQLGINLSAPGDIRKLVPESLLDSITQAPVSTERSHSKTKRRGNLFTPIERDIIEAMRQEPGNSKKIAGTVWANNDKFHIGYVSRYLNIIKPKLEIEGETIVRRRNGVYEIVPMDENGNPIIPQEHQEVVLKPDQPRVVRGGLSSGEPKVKPERRPKNTRLKRQQNKPEVLPASQTLRLSGAEIFEMTRTFASLAGQGFLEDEYGIRLSNEAVQNLNRVADLTSGFSDGTLFNPELLAIAAEKINGYIDRPEEFTRLNNMRNLRPILSVFRLVQDETPATFIAKTTEALMPKPVLIPIPSRVETEDFDTDNLWKYVFTLSTDEMFAIGVILRAPISKSVLAESGINFMPEDSDRLIFAYQKLMDGDEVKSAQMRFKGELFAKGEARVSDFISNPAGYDGINPFERWMLGKFGMLTIDEAKTLFLRLRNKFNISPS